MMVGSERNKRLIKEKTVLSREIHDLEQQHKTLGKREVWMSLQRSREEMRNLMEQETRKMYNLVKKDRYIYGSKALARALKKKEKD